MRPCPLCNICCNTRWVRVHSRRNIQIYKIQMIRQASLRKGAGYAHTRIDSRCIYRVTIRLNLVGFAIARDPAKHVITAWK